MAKITVCDKCSRELDSPVEVKFQGRAYPVKLTTNCGKSPDLCHYCLLQIIAVNYGLIEPGDLDK